ncbi:hypothetical protein IV417_01350 [Alphaproteobacteria bacterium KMM 3653]|uniref:YMGG-like Gly-zipper domain-containing protein n=1 Tax=Harenicola maris TaxID=2841044 RepID=A0AAP2CKD3_9RHOB|nr:hypothetical protein [Harenicola maris]
MYKIKWALALCAPLGLAACGDTDVERALSGAVAGAVVADATQNDTVTGALVGAGIGAFSDDVLDRLN